MDVAINQFPIDRLGLPESLRPFAVAFLGAVNAGLCERHIDATMRVAVLADRVLMSYLVARLGGQRVGPCAASCENHRKAVEELDEAHARHGAHAGHGAPVIGLADRMKPILKKAEGVLEEVLAYEAARRNAAQPSASQCLRETSQHGTRGGGSG
jgi:hypothetical protein